MRSAPAPTAILALLALSASGAAQERFPLGVLGAEATVTAGEARAVVVSGAANGAGARAGLAPGDAVIAIDGVAFPQHSNRVDDGGTGPQRSLGEALDSACDRDEGRHLTLRVSRAGGGAEEAVELDLRVDLPRRPGLGGEHAAEARAAMRAAAAAQLLRTRHEGGHWDSPVGLTGDRVLTAWAIVALLAHGDPEHADAIDRATAWLRGPDHLAWLPEDLGRGPDGLGNWALAFTSVAMAEHHHATGDEADLAVIARCNRALASRMDAEGKMGHDVQVGYSGKGFNVVNAMSQLAWAVGARVGVSFDDAAWSLSLDQLAASLDPNGGVRYWTMKGTGTGDASLRTSSLCAALSLTGQRPELRQTLFGYLDAHASRAREAHAVGSLGMLVQAPALFAVDRAAYDRFLAEWRWYFALMRGPDDRITYIGGKGNNGGDSYLGFDKIAAVLALHLLAVGDGRLLIAGAGA
ncbi:MAG: DUF6288 domain-containing protein [Planctomycetota bacterium]